MEPSTGPIRLDCNENPYGPPELAKVALQQSCGIANRYVISCTRLLEKIARHQNVETQNVVLGCGSTEILKISADLFLQPNSNLVVAKTTYPFLSSCARAKGVEVREVPLAQDFSHDISSMLQACNAATALVYLCNPNDPTGSVTPDRAVGQLLRGVSPNVPVLIDEAYHDYVNESSTYTSSVPTTKRYPNLIVTRTFSKIYGLAGLRIGYAITSPEMAHRLSPLRLPLGENALGIAAAVAALDDKEYVRISAERNANDRQAFINRANLRLLATPASQINSVLLGLDHPFDIVFSHFEKHGILLGRQITGLDKFVRVSIGRPEEMDEFWLVWDMLPHQIMHH